MSTTSKTTTATHNSSIIARTEYDAVTLDLTIEFKSGRTYIYHKVAPGVYDSFCEADSTGKYFNKAIRGCYEYEIAA